MALVLLAASSVANAQAQSLGEVARREQDRRKALTQPSKAYTNADVAPDTALPTSSIPSLASPLPTASQFVAHVIRIIDGDTIDVTTNNGADTLRLRLDGVDAPEFGQPFDLAALNFTRKLALGQFVTVHVVDDDQYGQLVARVLSQGKDLSVELVEAGLAWNFTQYSSDATLAAAEQFARGAGRGLWSDRSPVPPWIARSSPEALFASQEYPDEIASASDRTAPDEPASSDVLWQVPPPFIGIPIGRTCGVNSPREQALSNVMRTAGFDTGGTGRPCVAPGRQPSYREKAISPDHRRRADRKPLPLPTQAVDVFGASSHARSDSEGRAVIPPASVVGSIRRGYTSPAAGLTTQRNPTSHVEVSTGSGNQAAGR